MSHVITVKEANISVPGRGIVPDETPLLIDQRQMDSMARGPLFTSGKLQYNDPGLISKVVANLNTGLPAGAVVTGAGQQMTYAGSISAIGFIHAAAPVSTGLNIVMGVAVGANATTYVAPATSARVTFNAANFTNPVSNWQPLPRPVKFKKGQFLLPETVTAATPFVSGAAVLVLVLQDEQNAYSAYS